jgi:hypothetical protein
MQVFAKTFLYQWSWKDINLLLHKMGHTCYHLCLSESTEGTSSVCVRALDRGHIGIFYAFKMPKTHWRWCRWLKIRFFNQKQIFFGENDQPDTFYPTYYARIWLQMP